MDEFYNFFKLGIHHIWGLDALDHWLFLLALSIPFTLRKWKEWVWPVTGFTIGHAIALILAINGVIEVDPPLVEFLIPMTIVASAALHLPVIGFPVRYDAFITTLFGAIHGLGFSNVLRDLLLDSSVAIPLLGFNLGVELGQLFFLALLLLILDAIRNYLAHPTRVRWVLASVVLLWGAYLAFSRVEAL